MLQWQYLLSLAMSKYLVSYCCVPNPYPTLPNMCPYSERLWCRILCNYTTACWCGCHAIISSFFSVVVTFIQTVRLKKSAEREPSRGSAGKSNYKCRLYWRHTYLLKTGPMIIRKTYPRSLSTHWLFGRNRRLWSWAGIL